MSWEQLKHLPVQTKSGQVLGKVAGIIFDPETHGILQYEVKQGTFRSVLLISTSQVIGISAERMTVDDAAASQTKTAANPLPSSSPTVTGLASTRVK
jgi:uncharacterized protein YrrD